MDNNTVQWSQGNRACGRNPCFIEKQESNKDEKHGINCRRCSSTNTKFCYYNNYSLSQPRYFCKTCKRYWTEGGSLRNIPVGGISRKNMKRISSPNSISDNSSSSSSPPKKMILHHQVPSTEEEEGEIKRQDLNLGLIPSDQQSSSNNMFKTITDLIQVPDFDKNDTLNNLQHHNYSNYNLFMPNPYHHQLGSFHVNQEEEDTHMMRSRPAMLFPFQEIKQVERKSSDAAGGYRINGGGVLGSGLW